MRPAACARFLVAFWRAHAAGQPQPITVDTTVASGTDTSVIGEVTVLAG